MNLYFECSMGAAGDMLGSALLDLFDDRQAVLSQLNAIGLPHTVIEAEDKVQCGISGTHLNIIIGGEQEDEHSHHGHSHSHGRGMQEINGIIDSLCIDEQVKEDVRSIYTVVAEAESRVHNDDVSHIHFHELGMLDAIADITICSYLIRQLKPERIICSPINVGNGTVHCTHGILPVPAPATAEILKGIPYYKSDINTELCTPTGAAILRYFADEFVTDPMLYSVKKIGTGTGTKQLERANVVRVFMFDNGGGVTELSCNIDDMTGEETAYAMEKMLSEGALDCFVTPLIMKKGRPAYMFTVLCKSEDERKFAELIFRHTTTIGIRKYTPSRYTLDREIIKDGGARIKRSEGYGTLRGKIEFDDIKDYADENGISVFEARERLTKKS